MQDEQSEHMRAYDMKHLMREKAIPLTSSENEVVPYVERNSKHYVTHSL